MVYSQLCLFNEIDEKQVRSIVIKELKQYRALKIHLENKKEQKDKGIANLFPSLRDSSEEAALKVRQIEKALYGLLDDSERAIVEKKYLNNNPQNDLVIMEELCLKKDPYYRKKRYAIQTIATALAII
ncbi:hypothetical protein GCM10008967_00220 [Bacillus carboniphilus]|uniref:ArpU family transcriptional regulator n=1 Tax=Bacillus carboniphilus TaxID=86663 RepID=A0ABP3FE14_9BACI